MVNTATSTPVELVQRGNRVILFLVPVVIALVPVLSIVLPRDDWSKEMTHAEIMINATVSWFPFGSLYLLFIWTNHSGTFASSRRYKIAVTVVLVPLMIFGLAHAFLPLQNL